MPESEIIHRTEVRGVVFWVEKDSEGRYSAHSNSGDPAFATDHYGVWFEEDAVREMQREIETYEHILEKKRKAQPTPRQLSFLFRKKIPIPLTLTWGEASDLIDEKIKETTARFKGLSVGKRVTYRFIHPLRAVSGEVVKLTTYQGNPRYVDIRFDGEKRLSRFHIDSLPEMVADETVSEAEGA
jgi:hypothetical protein